MTHALAIRVARAEANRLFVRRRIRGFRRFPRRCAQVQAMDSFEVNKILGAVLGTCLGLLSINIAAGAIFAPTKPAKPGYEIVVPEKAPSGQPAEPQSRNRSSSSSPTPMSARRKRGQEMPSLPHLQQGRAKPGRPQSVGRDRPAQGIGGGLQLFRRAQGQGRHLGDRRPEPVHQQSPRLYSRHQHDVCRIQRGGERADVIAYLNSLSDNPARFPRQPRPEWREAAVKARSNGIVLRLRYVNVAKARLL